MRSLQEHYAAFLRFREVPEVWNQSEDSTKTSCHNNHNPEEDLLY